MSRSNSKKRRSGRVPCGSDATEAWSSWRSSSISGTKIRVFRPTGGNSSFRRIRPPRRCWFGCSSFKRAFWAPSGDEVVFGSRRNGQMNIYLEPVDGARSAEALSSGAHRAPTSISPDGKTILFRTFSTQGDHDIGALMLERDDGRELILHTKFDEHRAMFSPNGRWIAYVSNESGRDEVYVRSFPELQNHTPVSTHDVADARRNGRAAGDRRRPQLVRGIETAGSMSGRDSTPSRRRT